MPNEVANKLIPVVDGTAGTPIELQDARISTSEPDDGDYLAYDSRVGKFTNQKHVDNDTIPTAQCTTAASIQNKTATCSDFSLKNPSYLVINIKNANSYNGKITLNVNSTGAKDVWIDGEVSSSSNKTLPAGMYIAYYDGSKYLFRTDGKLPISGGAFGGSYNDLTNTPSLATVATSGSYNDLTDTPLVGKVVRVCTLQSDGIIAESGVCPSRNNGDVYIVTFGTTIPQTWYTCSPENFPTIVADEYCSPNVSLSNFQNGDTCIFIGEYTTHTNNFGITNSEWILNLIYNSRWGFDSNNNTAGYITANDIPEEVFVCTYNSSNNTMDKTPSEIYTAAQAGKAVICISDSNLILYCTKAYYSNNSYAIKFSSIQLTGEKAVFFINYNGSQWSYSQFNLQEKLIDSGTGQNLKTVNGTSLLGSGDIDTSELPDLTNHAGDVLTVSSGAAGVEWATPSSGGATSLDGLSDVSIDSPVNNEVLMYDDNDSEWENKPLSAVALSGSYNDLSNTPTIPDDIKVKQTAIGSSDTHEYALLTSSSYSPTSETAYEAKYNTKVKTNKNGDLILADSGTSPALVLARGTTSDGSVDIRILNDVAELKVKRNLNGSDTHTLLQISGASTTAGKITAINTITATGFIKDGGTSSQFLKADGSVDSTSYQPSLPSYTSNAGKVLAVNSNADGVEWVSQSSGGGGATALSGLSDVSISSASNGQLLQYDGSKWTNATFTAPKETIYGRSDTAAATATKEVTLNNYSPKDGDLVAVAFVNDVGAGASLNINSAQTSLAMKYQAAAITAGIIKAGDTALFCLNVTGSSCYLLSVDRPASGQLNLSDLLDVSMNSPTTNSEQVLAYTANGWRNRDLMYITIQADTSYNSNSGTYTISNFSYVNSTSGVTRSTTIDNLVSYIANGIPVRIQITPYGGGYARCHLYPVNINTSYKSIRFLGWNGQFTRIFDLYGENSSNSDVWTLSEIDLSLLQNTVTVYSGSTSPSSNTGSNGDIYIQTRS